MTAYLIAQVDVRDAEAYRDYVAHTPRVIAQFGGQMLVRNGARVVLEGAPDPRRVVVIAFPSMDDALRFHGSPDYAALRKIREAASVGQFIAIDGYAQEAWDTALAASRALTV